MEFLDKWLLPLYAEYKMLGLYLLLVNIVTFGLFAADKLRAVKGRPRIPEKTLLGISFIGGAVGGFLGMHIFRHKTKKPAFKYGLLIMIVLHIGVAVAIISIL